VSEPCSQPQKCSEVCKAIYRAGLASEHKPFRIVLSGSCESVQEGLHFDLRTAVLQHDKKAAEARVRQRKARMNVDVTE
jgi:hypothetical protein